MTDHLTRSFEAREDAASRRADAIDRRLGEILEDSIDVAESVFDRLTRRDDPHADRIATAAAWAVNEATTEADRAQARDIIARAFIDAWCDACFDCAEADVLADEERDD